MAWKGLGRVFYNVTSLLLPLKTTDVAGKCESETDFWLGVITQTWDLLWVTQLVSSRTPGQAMELLQVLQAFPSGAEVPLQITFLYFSGSAHVFLTLKPSQLHRWVPWEDHQWCSSICSTDTCITPGDFTLFRKWKLWSIFSCSNAAAESRWWCNIEAGFPAGSGGICQITRNYLLFMLHGDGNVIPRSLLWF